MSFPRKTINPKTGMPETAMWLAHACGPHHYGVQFADGGFYPAEDVQVA